MGQLIFTIRDGEDQILRPDGTEYEWFVRINGLKPLVPQRIGKSTMSISGKSGETRIRGTVIKDVITIPQVTLAELPIARDFANAMMYGFANPFYFDGTDNPGIHRPFWGVVVEDITPISNESCTEWSMSIPFTEVKDPDA